MAQVIAMVLGFTALCVGKRITRKSARIRLPKDDLVAYDAPSMSLRRLQRLQRIAYRIMPCRRIVMIGDSRIRRGSWVELLKSRDVSNRGIDGDTTAGVCGRLNWPLSANSEIVVVQVGINDTWKSEHSVTMENFAHIIDRLQNFEVVITSVLPAVDDKYGHKVEAINRDLMPLAGDRWLDISEVSTPDTMEADNLHLNRRGYEVMASIIAARVRSIEESLSLRGRCYHGVVQRYH